MVISFDSTYIGWTGAPIPVAKCLFDLHSLDVDSKIVELAGDYSTISGNPMDRETKQRQDCVDYLSDYVDWIVQLDTDELIPDFDKLVAISENVPAGIAGIEWPMRVLYRKVGEFDYLAVSDCHLKPIYEYPGPILVRANVQFRHARNIFEPIVRYSVRDDSSSLQLQSQHTTGITVVPDLEHGDAIIHNSWARSSSVVFTKIRSWGHSQGLKSLLYFVLFWYPSPLTWPLLRNFHPFARGLWPRLSVINVNLGKP